MDLEKLKDRLGDDYAALKAHVDDLTGQRDAARRESIDGRKSLKEQVATLTAARQRAFEKLGIENDEELETIPDAKGQAEAVKQFESRLKRAERERAEALTRTQEVEGKWRSSRLDAALTRAMAAHEFIDADLVSAHLSQQVQWDGDELYIKGSDGSLMPLAEGVKAFATTKPHLLKAQGARGSGHPTGAGSGGKATMTRGEFEALDPAARMKAAKEGVSLT